MASIAFVITNTDGTQTTKTATVADSAVAQLVGWALATMPTQYDASGNPVQKDAAWAVSRWVEGVIADTFAKVNTYQTQIAADAAAATVQPIAVQMT